MASLRSVGAAALCRGLAPGALLPSARAGFAAKPEQQQHEGAAVDLDEFREQVREFAQGVVAPHAEEIDRSNNFPTSVNLWKEMGGFGLLGE